MTEEAAASFQREGEIGFPSEDTAEETAAASQAENENQDGDPSHQGEHTDGDPKDVPFHEHPRWKQREEEWNNRFNEQEQRHQEDLKALREEFGEARKANAEQTKMPAWFGGTQEQWDAYRADRDAELKAAEDRAIARLTKERDEATTAEEKAVKDATDYMRSEMAFIEGDKTLNPSGAKFDDKLAKQLLQTVLDNNLVDTQGRWNYRAGWRILNGNAKAPEQKPKPDVSDKKEVAAATSGGGSKGEQPKQTFATSKDFEKDRPW